MRKAWVLTILLLCAFSASVLARPADRSNELDKFEFKGGDREGAAGVFGAAQAGTTDFGGTFWAADSGRWEAVADSCWTFDSGVGSHFQPDQYTNPYKDPSLHAYMEGWIGTDVSFSEITYFRRLQESDFTGPNVCVGAAAGLGGTYSLWCGVLPSEADELCYAGGQGYGDNWNVCVERSFAYTGGGVSLTYSYVNETENTWDFTYVIVDTSGAGDQVVATSYTGNGSGTENLNLSPGSTLPTSPGNILIQFCVVSDAGYSDQDGGNSTLCGAFAVDDISVSGGGISYSTDFESDDGGWGLSPAAEGAGGEWSQLEDLTALPPFLTPCDCTLQDSVMLFEDLSAGGHNQFADNLAVSPWIDLRSAGLDGAPGKLITYDIYAEMPVLNYIFSQSQMQWYPEVCPNTGKVITSTFTSDGFVGFYGNVPFCTTVGGLPIIDDFSAVAAVGTEQARIALGVISYCSFFSDCTGVTNSTPWFDNVKMQVFGDPAAPAILTTRVDRPQDTFPENGTLRPDAAGRFDVNNVKNSGIPEVGTQLGDTLVVNGGAGGAEVWVQFAVDPGPGIDNAAFNTWLTSHQFEETKNGQDWYAARLDTAQQGGNVQINTWMGAYHENDPNFQGTDNDVDPNDLPPSGVPSRLLNDIFPDDLFTPGTRVELFFKTKFIAGSTWYTEPDTGLAQGAATESGAIGGFTASTPRNAFEWECLPSSMAADSTFNCVLYVDHFSSRGGQPFIERGLDAVMDGGSENYENTPWDRYDVEAPSSQQASLGRPLDTEYGATVNQILGYKAILWNSGNLDGSNLVKEDADILIPWLTLLDFGNNNLWLNGNNLAESMSLEAVAEPSATILLEDIMGVLWDCATFRDLDCPIGTPEDTTACITIDPVGGAVVANRPLGEAPFGQGNGCPQLRSFDVLQANPSANFGNAADDEEWENTVKQAADPIVASVSIDASGFGPVYRGVTDGISVHYRRDPGVCTFSAGSAPLSVEGRIEEVLSWFGFSGAAAECEDPTASVSVPDTDPRQPTFRTTLANFAPNPLTSGLTGRIQFTMAREGRATVDVFDVNGRLVKTVFDGVAQAGPNEALWNGTDASERPVASGVYFYRLRSNEEDFSKKMIVVRNGN